MTRSGGCIIDEDLHTDLLSASGVSMHGHGVSESSGLLLSPTAMALHTFTTDALARNVGSHVHKMAATNRTGAVVCGLFGGFLKSY